MKIVNWAQKYIKEIDFDSIETAVEDVEKKTEAEIVPMIVRISSPVGHIFPLLSLGFLFFFVVLEYWLIWDFHFFLAWLLPITGLASLVLAYFLAKIPCVQRLFSSKEDMKGQVFHRAELEFYRQHLDHTKRKKTILIFVSLMERQAYILADPKLSEKLPIDTWKKAIKIIVDNMKQRQSLGLGLQKAIVEIGAILREQFPSQGLQDNEMANKLIIKD